MKLKKISKFMMLLVIAVFVSSFMFGCEDDEADPPMGRVDNWTSYNLYDLSFAGTILGDCDALGETAYVELPETSGKFKFSFYDSYDGSRYDCETPDYLDAPEEDKKYSIKITGGGDACGYFGYQVIED